MRKFSEMNHSRLGLIGIGVLAVVLLLLFNLTQFASLVGNTTYKAEFAHAGGLLAGDKVRLGGAPVGSVRDVELAGDRVLVSFDVDGDVGRLGQATSAAIKTETLLGRKYVELSPQGNGEWDPDKVIPLSRTSVPYNITDQLGELTELGGAIDTQRLANAMDSIAAAFADSPPELRKALRGLTRFSRSIHSRDSQIKGLLSNAEGVTGILADRSRQLTKLFVDGSSLMAELERRREHLRTLLVNVRSIANQMKGLVRDNDKRIGPALKRLNSVLDLLRKNEGSITAALQRLGPFAGSLGEALGNGPFWSAYIANLNVVPVDALTKVLPGGSK